MASPTRDNNDENIIYDPTTSTYKIRDNSNNQEPALQHHNKLCRCNGPLPYRTSYENNRYHRNSHRHDTKKESSFHFYKNGHEHFHPPIAVLGG